MRPFLILIVVALGFAAPAEARTLREAISGKVLFFPNDGQYILFSLNPDGTGVGQEKRGGKARPEAIRWRLSGRALCIGGKPGGMSSSGREECVGVRVRGRTIWVSGPGGKALNGEIRDRK
ncbi:hypothetical protein [Vannielia litorea]|uniref:hypothetical protein n=1 Tax=Vannielia litorea TaxID=1217970 RepID=UPI001BCB6CD8|nr:hypothetical protein [Vannielia litorea]MBS8228290.1 hypothetical protein [Vannielia litorea]